MLKPLSKLLSRILKSNKNFEFSDEERREQKGIQFKARLDSVDSRFVFIMITMKAKIFLAVVFAS